MGILGFEPTYTKISAREGCKPHSVVAIQRITTLWVKEFKRIDPLFATHLLTELRLEQYNGGVAVPTLNRNDVHRVDILCPPSLLHTQFVEFTASAYAQIKILRQQIAQLEQARDILLPRLMNGEIIV